MYKQILFILFFNTVVAIAAPATVVPKFCEKWLTQEASIAQAQAETARILEARGQPILEELTYPDRKTLENARARGQDIPHAEQWTLWGIPSGVEVIDHSQIVFRHYATEDIINKILETGVLQTGYAGYAEVSPRLYDKHYPNLSGVFLTLPTVSRRSIGVDSVDGKRYGYLDIRINQEIPVIKITKEIFLIGLRPRTRDWIANSHYKVKAGITDINSLSATHQATLSELEQLGGPNTTPAAIPFTVVGYGLE